MTDFTCIFNLNSNSEDPCEAMQQTIDEMKPQMIKVLKMILPRLANGFKNQKDCIFGFTSEDAEESRYSLSNMDQRKLKKTPIYNPPEERRVGFMNYELKLRGKTQPARSSSAQVEAKFSDLIKKLPPETLNQDKKTAKPDGRLPEIIKICATNGEELLKKRMKCKEIANTSADR